MRRQKFESVTRRTMKVQGTSRLGFSVVLETRLFARSMAFQRRSVIASEQELFTLSAVIDFGFQHRYGVVQGHNFLFL